MTNHRTRPINSAKALRAYQRQETEAEFQQKVIQLARLQGWLVHHHQDSRRSEPGFYDLVLVRPPRFLVVELKREGGTFRKAQLSPKTVRLLPGQRKWAEAAKLCIGVEYYFWMPSNWEAIVKVLT